MHSLFWEKAKQELSAAWNLVVALFSLLSRSIHLISATSSWKEHKALREANVLTESSPATLVASQLHPPGQLTPKSIVRTAWQEEEEGEETVEPMFKK